jgi:hypothetical protein
MTSGIRVGETEIKLPAKVRVDPKKGSNVQIFEQIALRGNEAVLQKVGQYIKAGGSVTVLEVEDCTVDNCECKLGTVAGPDPRKHFVIRLDDVELAPLNN